LGIVEDSVEAEAGLEAAGEEEDFEEEEGEDSVVDETTLVPLPVAVEVAAVSGIDIFLCGLDETTDHVT